MINAQEFIKKVKSINNSADATNILNQLYENSIGTQTDKNRKTVKTGNAGR